MRLEIPIKYFLSNSGCIEMYMPASSVALGLFSASVVSALAILPRQNDDNSTDIAPNLAPVPANSSSGPSNSVVNTLALSSDSTFQFQLLLVNGLATYHGSDTNDVLKTALYIEPGNFESFAEAFQTLAAQTKAKADATVAQSDALNARDTYFAAASYYRSADFFLHGNWSDPRIDEFWNLQTECYDKAIAALPVPGQRVTISATGFDIPAIYYAPQYPSRYVKRPTIVIGNGYDAAQEEAMHFYVFAALSRGWNVLTYEGPGQPTVRRNQGIGFIPDWEKVVTPVVDYLYQREDVDCERLALLGCSFGGYLAARAAAFEPRIKALLLDGGIYSAYTSFTDQLTPSLKKLYELGNKQKFDDTIAQLLSSPETPSGLRWGVEQGLWSFDIQSPYDFLQSVKAYTIANITNRIQMPTWIAEATDDQFYTGQPQLVKKALGSRATLHPFTGASGYHTQVGSTEEANRVLHIWLNEVFNMTSEAPVGYSS